MKGVYTIEKRKAIKTATGWEMGDLIESRVAENRISDPAVFSKNLYIGTYSLTEDSTLGMWISRSSLSYPISGYNTSTNSSWAALGSGSLGVSTPVYYPARGSQDAFWQTEGRWDPPSEDTTWKTLGDVRTFSILELDPPLVQTTTEILSISYKLFLAYDETSSTIVLPRYQDYINKWAALGIDTFPVFISSWGLLSEWFPQEFNEHNLNILYTVFTDDGTNTETYYGHDGILKIENFNAFNDTTDNVGLPVSRLAISPSYFKGASLRPSSVSKIQNTFAKSAHVLPFLDANNPASGGGTVTLTESGWEGNGLIEEYGIDITATNTYKFWKRPSTSTYGNVLSSRRLNHPVLGAWDENNFERDETVDGSSIQYPGLIKYEDVNDYYNSKVACFFQACAYPDFVTADFDALAIHHTYKPSVILDANSTPALPVTNICQIQHTENGNIYVACADTGLYEIVKTPGGAVSAINRITASNAADDTSCRGFQIKRSDGTWWALFDTELCSSTDNGSTWTVYNGSSSTQFLLTGVTDTPGQQERIICMYLDGTSANDEFVFNVMTTTGVTTTNNGSNAYWWSRAGSAGGTSDELNFNPSSSSRINARLVASRRVYCTNAGEWIFVGNNVANSGFSVVYDGFNGTSRTAGSNGLSAGNNKSINVLYDKDGNDWITVGDTSSDNEGPYLVQLALGFNNSKLSEGQKAFGANSSTSSLNAGFFWAYNAGVYLTWSNGLALVKRDYNEYDNALFVSLIGDDMGNRFAEHYGWTGSAWEKGAAGSKAVHTASESLVGGVSASFSNDTFVAGDKYITYIYDGILKDNATSFDVKQNVFFSPVQDVTTLESSTVPASDVGSVTEELFSQLNVDRHAFSNIYDTSVSTTSAAAATNESSLFPHAEPGRVTLGDPGYIRSDTDGRDNACLIISEQALVGDFTVSFKIDTVMFSTLSSEEAIFYLREWSSEVTQAFGPNGLPEMINLASDTSVAGAQRLDIQVLSGGGTTELSLTQVAAPDYRNDEFVISRVGSTITYSYGGSTFYTSTSTSTADLQLCFYVVNCIFNAYDIKITTTHNRRLVRIGDASAQTGAYDADFMKLMTSAEGRPFNSLTMDGSVVNLKYDGSPPAAGEVTLLPFSGRLWFNSADAGKSLSGTFRYRKPFDSNKSLTAGTGGTEYAVTVSGGKFFLDGVEAPALTLTPGETYYFLQEDPSNLGTQLSVSWLSESDGVNELEDNIEKVGSPGTANSWTRFTVPRYLNLSDNIVYYYNTQTIGYGNTISF